MTSKIQILFLSLVVLTFSCSSESPKPPMKTLSADEIKYPLPKKLSEKGYIHKLKNKDCTKFIQCYSPKEIAEEMGKSEEWAIANYDVNIWEKTSADGKGWPVGKMRCGSRALLIEESGDDYLILSPLDQSIGWVSKVQIAKVIFQNPTTFEECEG